MTVRGLDHVNIITHDLAGSAAFYQSLLGLAEISPPPLPPGVEVRWLGDATGRAIIHLQRHDPGRHGSAPAAGETGAVHHVAFDCEDFDSIQRRCAELGADHRVGMVTAAFSQLFVTDPNGVLLELNFRH